MPEQNQQTTRPIVPVKYSGQWIAWNAEETAIVASAATMDEVLQQAEAQGITMPPVEYIPPSSFIGGWTK